MTESPQTPNTPELISWFRQSSPYINRHRGKTFVIMVPGDCINQSGFTNIVSDITLLHNLGVKVILVHGARPQIEANLIDHETKTTFHRGIRITPESHIAAVAAAVGSTRAQIEANFSAGLPNSPMYGAKVQVLSGNLVTAMPQGIIDGIDYQYTGKVRSIASELLQELLYTNSIVLISPMGYSLTGEMFNLSFADIAVQTAIAAEADKLIAYNDDGVLLDVEQNQYRELTLLKCEKFLVNQQDNQSNTYFALRACHRACESGIPRTHVISSQQDGALLQELYTREGSGTMVYRDSYESIRKARITDVAGILRLIEPLEKEGILVKRSRERLENEIHHFTVMEKDELLVGCAGLYPIANAKTGELACVAIHPEYRNGKRAAKLLTHIERQASRLKIDTIFALTTQTGHWFLEQGFIEATISILPEERQDLYNYHRKSKVYIKNL